MKKYCLALIFAVAFCAAGEMESAGWAAPASVDQTLEEAWTAYNIGQYKKALGLLQPLATDGDARAQVMLGRCYENGLGVPQNMETAAKWYRLAAEQNNSEGQVLLAYCYGLGAGVPRDEAALLDLMGRAADGGNAEARFNMALYYGQGLHGLAKDSGESFRWAKLAADQGYAQAQRYVGACYEHGVGISENPAEAALWYGRAAAQGLEKEGNIFNRVQEYGYTKP